jgi:hypothetical protein
MRDIEISDHSVSFKQKMEISGAM